MFKYLGFVILCLEIFIRATNADCMLDLRRSLPAEKLPIYLTKDNDDNFSWFVPSGQQTTFRTNEKLYAYCPDMRANKGITEITCTANGNFPVKSIQCENEIEPELRQTDVDCYEGFGKIWRLGFYIPDNSVSSTKSFKTTVTICYNVDVLETIYTYHNINGKAIRYQMNRAEQRFSDAGIPTRDLNPRVNNADNVYTKNYQSSFFDNLYGSNQNYITSNNFITRGHMAPAGDFIFHPEKRSTFFLVNAAPQFKSVNSGNWETIEKLTRNLASKQNRQVGVITGTFMGISFKNTKTNKDIPATLSSKGRFPVPQYYWRIILDTTSKAAIAFITQNNPYSTTPTTLCQNRCNEAGFVDPNFTNYNSGYTICCKYDEFVNGIQLEVPPEFETESFPNLITNV